MSRTVLRSLLLVTLAAFAASANADVVSVNNDDYGTKLTFAYNGVDFAFRYCPANEAGTNGGFWIASTETTQAQYKLLMNGSNPTESAKQGDNRPVSSASWDSVQGFITALNTVLSGLENATLTAYLPTEVQWDYAARAGTTGTPENLINMGWFQGVPDYTNTSHDVATKDANAWGIYDMYGNVWERVVGEDGSRKIFGQCWDGWDYNVVDAKQNYDGDSSAVGFRVLLTGTYEAPGGGDGGGNVAPEPATLALFGLGIAGLAVARRRRK